MTQTLSLQFLSGLCDAIQTALRDADLVGPNRQSVSLDRNLPVGDNEQRPLVIIRRPATEFSRSPSCGLTHSIQLEVLLHVKKTTATSSITVALDPYLQVVHRAIMEYEDIVPWCQAIFPGSHIVEPMDANQVPIPGLAVLSYTAQIMTAVRDLTTTP